ncbi:unnamed protein product [Cochlearia groenlandica]
MDFHRLMRRDLQFLCKRNMIPANMTNLAMADSLKALELVDGLDEFMNQSESNAPHSPTSIAKQPPTTATRTTRRKTAVKAEPQSSSQSVVNRKSLAGEMDQESKTNNVKFEASVAKTPAAARTTRKALAATSCTSKVQSVYSTRRSTRLLEKCMADLSLKTKETLDDKPEKNEETGHKVSIQENNPAGSEAEVIPGRDLNASMEKEWEILKNESDQVVEDLELSVGTSHIAVFDANTGTNKEMLNEFECDEKESENSLVEETLQAEEVLKNNDNDLVDAPVLEYANTETHKDNKESLDISLLQETEQAIQEFDKISNMDTMVDQTDHDSETKPGEDDSGVETEEDTISEADSNQAVLGSDIADEDIILPETEVSATSPPPRLEEAKVKAATPPPPRPSSPSKNSPMNLISEEEDSYNKENNNDNEMMVKVESKGEMKKVDIDEERLRDVSMRQLVKMVKKLSIKSGNRTALKMLPNNNQIAE